MLPIRRHFFSANILAILPNLNSYCCFLTIDIITIYTLKVPISDLEVGSVKNVKDKRKTRGFSPPTFRTTLKQVHCCESKRRNISEMADE
jgi:hypothetical protein